MTADRGGRRIGREGSFRPLAARAGLLLALAAAILFTVRCSREFAPARGEGGLALTWKVEPGTPLSAADSVRTWVLDGQDRILAGPVTVPFDTSAASFDLALRVSAGEDRAVRMQLEGDGARGRGVLADGETRGIVIPVAGTAAADLRLHDAVPRLEPFRGQPGDLEITLRWSAVPGASGYHLYRGPAAGGSVELVPDTVRVFALTDLLRWSAESSLPLSSKGRESFAHRQTGPTATRPGGRASESTWRAPAALDTTWFRVSAILPGPHGKHDSVVSDSLAVSFGWVEDTPRVVRVAPADGAAGVPDSAGVEIEFDRPMDPLSLGDVGVPAPGNTVTLSVEGTAEFVGLLVDPVSWSADSSRVLRLQPSATLRRDAHYRLEVSTGLRDRDGRPLDQSRAEAGLQGYASSFYTEPYDPLRVTGSTPSEGATGVDPRPLLELVLNRPARPTTVSTSSVGLADSLGAAAPCAVELVQDSLIRVTPLAPLRFATRYQLSVTTDVRDRRGRNGEPLDQDSQRPGLQPFVLSFRTIPQPSGPSAIAVTPADGASGVPLSQVVRIRFSRPVQTTSVGGALLVLSPGGAAIQGSVAPASADRTEFSFTPVELLPGFLYTVKAWGGTDPQGNPLGIRDDQGVPFDQDSTVAGYQIFESTFRAEKTPRVESVRPAPGREGVPVDTLVELRFSEPIDPASITPANLALLRDEDPVAIHPLEWSSDGKLVRLRPARALGWLRGYTVLADTSLRAVDHSRLDQYPGVPGYQPFRSEFWTLPDGIPPRVASWLPGEGTTDVPVTTPVTVRFSKPVVHHTVLNEANFLLRRKQPGSPGLPADRAITADSLEATLTPAAPLENGTEYEVVVQKFVEDRFGQQLDQDSVAAFNQDFTGSFRTEIERVSPRVASIEPTPGAEEVAIDAAIRVTFSEPMAPLGLAEAFSLRGPDGPVPGTPLLEPGQLQLRFTPALPLRWAVEYFVRIDTTAADAAGNRFDQWPELAGRQPFESTFTTMPDRVPPRVIGSVPADGDSAVDVTVQPRVDFSETMAAGTFAAGMRLLDSLGAPVALAAPSVAEDRRSATLVPIDSLLFSAAYTLEVGEAVQDTSGNGLDQDPDAPDPPHPYRAVFRTRPENIPPRVRNLRFDGGPPVPISTQIRAAFSEAIDPATVTAQTVRLLFGEVGVEATLSLSAPDTALLVPVAPLLNDTTYAVVVEGIGDLRGNLLDQDPTTPGTQAFRQEFRTVPDLVPPRVVRVFPSPDSTGVDPGVELEVEFDEPVDPATVVVPSFAVYCTDSGADLRPGSVTPLSGNQVFRYRPDAALPPGARFQIHVTGDVRDRSGNPLDQDPATPASDPFVSEFYTGTPPLAEAGNGVCDPATSVVVLAASADRPDSSLSVAEVRWGDGTAVETIPILGAPWGSLSHTYPCLDVGGCNREDDDHDGHVDESGPAGCDESYRITLRVRDRAGLWSAWDSTGVSFCNLQVLSSIPADSATGVDTLLTELRLEFSRSLDPASLSTSRLTVDTTGVPVSLTVEPDSADDRVVILRPDSPLRPGLTYTLRALTGIQSADGRLFDQDPCATGDQPFEAIFQTQLRVAPPPSLAPEARRPGPARSHPPPAARAAPAAQERDARGR